MANNPIVEPTNPPHLDPKSTIVKETLLQKVKKFIKNLFK